MNNKKIFLVGVVAFVLSACTYVPVNEGPSQSEKASDINVQLGIGYLQQNNLEVANQKLSRALIQNPKSAVAHNAFAILQERLQEYDKAEKHYRKGAELDITNSQANNNFGAFLCKRGRQAESEKYFLIALKQPLYKTPEFAYTNAGVCLMQIEQYEKAENYFKKALAARSNFSSALINMSDLTYKQKRYSQSLVYLKRYNLVKNVTARSLSLEAHNHMELDNELEASKKIAVLKEKYPESKEYLEWKSLTDE